MKRRSGSVKFDAYYKAQWWDPMVCAWRDIQRGFATIDECRAVMDNERKWRVMEITTNGRHPVVTNL